MCANVYMYVHVCECVYVCVHVCRCVYGGLLTYAFVHVCVCVFMRDRELTFLNYPNTYMFQKPPDTVMSTKSL